MQFLIALPFYIVKKQGVPLRFGLDCEDKLRMWPLSSHAGIKPIELIHMTMVQCSVMKSHSQKKMSKICSRVI